MKKSNQKKNRPSEITTGIKATGLPPTHEEIRLRAYEIFMERGGANGNEQDDWLLAEYELKQQHSRKSKTT